MITDNRELDDLIKEDQSLTSKPKHETKWYIVCALIGGGILLLCMIGFFTWIVVCGDMREGRNYTTNLCI